MAFGKWSFLLKYIWPPSVFSGVLTLIREWHKCDVKNKAILVVLFTPAFLSVGGLVLYIVRFVLFVLPSFILTLMLCLLLISLFSGGALFFYEKIRGKRTSRDQASYDYDVTSDVESEDDEKSKKKWFDDMKWFKK